MENTEYARQKCNSGTAEIETLIFLILQHHTYIIANKHSRDTLAVHHGRSLTWR